MDMRETRGPTEVGNTVPAIDPIIVRRALVAGMRKLAARIRDRHRYVLAARENLPLHTVPLAASYWADQLHEASRLEKAAAEAEAKVV